MALSLPWTIVPKEASFTCRKCGSHDVVYRKSEDDDCHEDYEYHCKNCNRYWWVEGSDY
jgi:DNA-directed RNA polymerase subunit M/transcription elongation factor TFIIS